MENTKTFADFSLSNEMLKAIEDMGFEEPTPIQSMAIPLLLQNCDVTGQAQTGTGKTAAFGVPIIEKLNPNDRSVQALVLSPTHELAIQTVEEFSKLMKYKKGLSVIPIYGGQAIERQLRGLKGAVQVVVGTPGRVIDHLNRGSLDLSSVRMFVLDEADQMLDMGFREDIEEIFQYTPEDRQTILFSATMPKPILEIANRFQHDPQFVKITRRELTVPSIDQKYIEVRERDKLEVLCRLLDMNSPELSIVFCNTKRTVDELVNRLSTRGYLVEALHGDMKQVQRDRAMSLFRNGNIDVLIATDVAARGIDVDDVDVVFNYDVPQDVEYYVHRIGRTGRAGRTGKSITFVAPREIYKLRDIQKYTKIRIEKTPIPTLNDVDEMRMQIFINKVCNVISEGDLDKYLPMIEKILETNEDADTEITTLEVAAALLKMHLNTGKNSSDTSSQHQNELTNSISPESFENTGAEPGMVRLKLSLGKNQQIRPKDIVGAIAGECDISGNSIGRIDLYSNYSFVEVPIDYASTVLDIMNQKDIRGHDVEFQVATPKPCDDDRHRGSMRNHSSYRNRTITRSSINSRFNHRVGRRQYRFGM